MRTGEFASKPIHRLGRAPIGTIEAVREEADRVLEQAFGEDGATKRANMKKLQAEILNVWNEGGPARRDLLRFLSVFSN